jgi:hypothetical protein
VSVKARATVPITPEMVRGWFVAAGAWDTSEEAAALVADLCERYRTLNSDEIREGERALARWVTASHDYLQVLLGLPDYLKRLPEVRALAIALKPVVRYPADKRGRPTDAGTRATAALTDALAAVLPSSTTVRARHQITEAALRACGWGEEKTSENIARTLRRRRSRGRT